MLDNLGIVLAAVCVLFGAFLLQDSLADPNASQGLRVIGGAVLLTLGLVVAWFVVKRRLEWRRNRNDRHV
jgi:uncharacterized membrane protein YdjX (TVP38/TMEM64 family)